MVPRLWPLHVLALWAVAVAHPLLDPIGRSPEFLVSHRIGPAELLLLVVVLLVVPPLPLIAAVALARIAGGRAQAVVLGIVVWGLAGVLAAQAARHLGVTTWTAASAAALLAGAATAVLYSTREGVRSFVTVLAAAMVVVPAVFLLRPGVTSLWLPRGDGVRTAADPLGAGFLPAPVVFMVFDEMPLVALLAGNHDIDRVAYPSFSTLARDGIWFRNATTVSDYTRWALPSILTGRYPQESQLPTPRDHPETLISWFSRTHRMEVFESATDLCPPDLCGRPQETLAERAAGLADDLSVLAAHVVLTPDLLERWGLPDLSGAWAGFDTPDGAAAPGFRWRRRTNARRELTAQFVETIQASDPQPTFYFLHPLLPHQPWGMLPRGQRNSSLAPLPRPMRAIAHDDEWEIAQNQQRQLLQIGYVDHVVGSVIDRLRRAGLYDRALIVVTADHGFAITSPHHVRSFSPGNAAEIMRVPLIVKFPAGMDLSSIPVVTSPVGHRVSDRNVETVDIAPTVAHALGVPFSWTTDGTSLLDPSRPPRPGKRIWFGQVRKVQHYGAEGPPPDEVVRRRHALFGDGNVYHVPRPPRFGELIGRPVDDLPLVESALVGDLRYAWRYRAFDPAADAVPLDVSGELRGPPPGSGPTYLAVAINGVVEAVTRTWTSRSGWLATLPLDVWRPGENSVEVFAIAERAGGVALERVRLPSRPDDLNLISGHAAQFWNVRQHGFHRHERKGSQTFRWTRGRAAVTVPLLGRRPAAVRVVIDRAIRSSTRVRIAANDCVLHDGRVRRGWDATLPLDGCRLEGDSLTISVVSDVAPARGRDRRRLGVAVRRITVEMADPAPAPG